MAALLVAAAAGGQTTPNAAYRIGPRDLVSIEVPEWDELTVERRVAADGTIVLPHLGQVGVGGLTSDEVRDKLVILLTNGYLQRDKAIVVVELKEFLSQPISVLGAVRTAGPLSFPGNWTLLEAITAAGGVTENRGDTVFVLRRASNGLTDQLAIDLAALLRAEPTANIPIFANDLITVPAAEKVTVYCGGAVNEQGALEFSGGEEITVMKAIIRAGGLSDRAGRKALIRRGSREIEVDVKAILAGRAADVPLEPGDVVHVKEAFF